MKLKTTFFAFLMTASAALNAGSIYWPEELRKLEQAIFGNNCSLPIDTIRTVRIGYKTFTVKAKQRVKRIDLGYGTYHFKAERTIKIFEKNLVHRSTVTSGAFYEKPMTEAKAGMVIAGGLCTLIGGAMLLFANSM